MKTRRKKTSAQKQTIMLNVMASPLEKQILTDAAALAGLPLSTWIRSVALHAARVAATHRAAWDEADRRRSEGAIHHRDGDPDNNDVDNLEVRLPPGMVAVHMAKMPPAPKKKPGQK